MDFKFATVKFRWLYDKQNNKIHNNSYLRFLFVLVFYGVTAVWV